MRPCSYELVNQPTAVQVNGLLTIAPEASILASDVLLLVEPCEESLSEVSTQIL